MEEWLFAGMLRNRLLKGMWVGGHLKNEGLLIGAWMRVTETWVSGCLQDMGKGYSQEHRIRS